MTDKEFKNLNRGELVTIIYEYQKNIEQLEAELAEAKAKLADRELKISRAGSLAEVAANLNELFEAAQKTADEYLERTKEYANREARAMLTQAREEAHEIKAKAKRKAAMK